jgi:hypothetical protein
LNKEQRREVRETVRQMRQDGASREEIRDAVDALLKKFGVTIPESGQEKDTPESAGSGKLEIQNFPNPFNPETTIKYVIQSDEQVTAQIFDVQGKLVRSLLNDYLSAGTHTIRWDGLSEKGTQVPSGIYFIRLNAGAETVSKRLVLTK